MSDQSRHFTPALLMVLMLAGCNDGGVYPVVGTLERDRIALAAELAEPVTSLSSTCKKASTSKLARC